MKMGVAMDFHNESAVRLSRRLYSANKQDLALILEHYCTGASADELQQLQEQACALRQHYYGDKVYFRGLIEFTSYCRNDCHYCGIRSGNGKAKRYRLSEEEILGCCEQGHALGFRTFVLQGGEDAYYTDGRMSRIVYAIKSRFPDCAITLSLGERSFAAYKQFFDAGADRYLLRHETADEAHYAKLHPANLRLSHRKQCLYDLKAIGYQVGAGFMVESPFQSFDTLAEDFIFLRELNPHMIGIGPFIPHQDSIFAGYPTPTAARTLILLSLIRLMLPKTLLPATTALGTIDSMGREKGLQAGANVVMPNLSPVLHRKDYALYDNKICTGEEAAECLQCLSRRIEAAGFTPAFSRGDYIDLQGEGYIHADRT